MLSIVHSDHGLLRAKVLSQNLEIRIRKHELGVGFYIHVMFILLDFCPQYIVLRGPEVVENFDTYLFHLLMGLNHKIVNKIIQVVASYS